MSCPKCRSGNQAEFSAEVNIHFPGLKNLDRPSKLVFSNLLVCLDYGFAECTVPEKRVAVPCTPRVISPNGDFQLGLRAIRVAYAGEVKPLHSPAEEATSA
jgi:hypothetical protein